MFIVRFLPFAVLSAALLGCVAERSRAPADADAVTSAAADPYLWLEDIDADKSLTWVRKQNARSLGELEGDPRFKELYAEALEVLTSDARIPYGDVHGTYVYNFWQDEQHVRGLWRRAPLAGYAAGEPRWETLLDVDALDAREQQNWIFKGSSCLPPEFEHCLLRLSRGGTDASVFREFSVPAKALVAGGFEIPEAKSNAAWVDKDTLLVATDWGDGLTASGYPKTIRLWRRGSPLASAEKVFSGQPSDVAAFASVLRDSQATYRFALRAVTFFESELLWLRPEGAVKVPLPPRASLQGLIDGRVLATLEQDWEHGGRRYPEGALVAVRLEDMSAELVYAPRDGEAINGVAVSERSAFVELLDNVVGKVRRVRRERDGWRASDMALPPNGAVEIASVNDAGDDLLVSYESLTVPDSLFYVDADNAVQTVMSLPPLYDASDAVVEQRFATSADGTRVPYFLLGQRDVLARGNAPTVQYGYGGFQVAVLPTYYEDEARPQHGALAGRLWLARGGVLALANIRGGGEFGPAWHKAALLHNRHKAFEDFFAVSEALIASGVTSAERLGAIGRSNGGLLMGVALTQRPDLYAAIDCGVPLLDMLRYHKLLAGASWMGEYGNPEVPEDRAYLATYSPLQQLRRDVDYPPVFFYTSTRDDRVHPGHARRMAARMAEFGHPFLYYENIEGGHGGAANQAQLARRAALEYMFFLRTLAGTGAATARLP